MYAIELTPELLRRLHVLRTKNGQPIAHQVRNAVAKYCDSEEARLNADEVLSVPRPATAPR